MQRETLLCQFLYTYLTYSIQQMFNKPTSQQEEASGGKDPKDNPIARLYRAVLRFIGCFQESRQPPTLCWLLEILNILSIKFSPMDAYRGDQKLKKDYYELLNQVLDSVAVIINDNFKVNYVKGYNFLIAFPP